MSGPRRELAVAHRTELAPEGVARDRERELVPDPLGRVGKPPAHYTVRGGNWPGLDNRGKRGALLAVQDRATPRCLARRQTIGPAFVEPQTQSRTISRVTPAILAASLRLPPSRISAIANSRRT